mgnify:CR=1 FL=1
MTKGDKHRIARVTTRTGDQGETGLADGSRVAKDAPLIVALGEVDELNATLGLLCAELSPAPAFLQQLQQRLFDLGAELAVPGSIRLQADDLAQLDEATAELNNSLPPLREFVLPGGSRAGACSHLCRTVARRAERALLSASREQKLNPLLLPWINRLSDYFFVLARILNRDAGVAEDQWQPRP